MKRDSNERLAAAAKGEDSVDSVSELVRELSRGEDRSARRIWAGCTVIAVFLHLAAVFVTFPVAGAEEPAGERSEPRPVPIRIHRIPPPPPESSPVLSPPTTAAVPIPVAESPAVEPVWSAEPMDGTEWDAAIETELAPLGEPRPAPPERALALPGVGGVTLPEVVSRVEPRFPELARKVRLEGKVVLSARILPDGTVGPVDVVDEDPEGVGFADAAVEAVEAWRYRPALSDGRPVAVEMRVVVTFRLD